MKMLGQNSTSLLNLSIGDGGGNHGQVQSQSLDMDPLPKQFVVSMKKLFDILDDKQSGYVRYTDIEKGWQDDGSKGLPRGVLDSLRRVTPPSSGLLSFERFCAGLKLCLLRNQQQAVEDSKMRSHSQVNLSPEMDYSSPAPPPKPPRQVSKSPALGKADIRHALQNWQLNLMADAGKPKVPPSREQFEHRGSADGGSSSTSASATDWSLALPAVPKKTSSKRRESRRHTLQHGIDYNMLKRMKQLEEQRELLLFGLDGVEKARDWYMQQVLNVQEQIKYFGRLGTRFEQWSELQQERLNFQRARVLEANRSLQILADTWEHGGYPLHINLALPTPTVPKPRQMSDLLSRVREKTPVLSNLYDPHHSHSHPQFLRAMSNFVLSQPSPVSQSSAGLGDADVVY
ncbi:suppressor APC domain-containing protein 2 [Drosophila eugracilis]|uniref:suppressor APC domain-containing protein 2 n=1 Tax=Drosophila eugracilis TaxID=29029 RepID=UPI001BDB504A|nr:suppressor APC domain-containing protein 2 [Drosophila eugracilis]XP_017070237.2 suppressor APC domain-containing protein 2 [Drosophila eugracilis]